MTQDFRYRLVTIGLTLILLAIIISTMINQAHADPKFPDRGTAAVVDTANKFSPEGRHLLNNKLVEWQRATHHHFVVATVPDLQGYSVSEYGYKLGRYWKLGNTGQDDGVILFWAANDKRGKIRLEVGRGIEPAITDALSKQITDATAAMVAPKGVEAALTSGAGMVMMAITEHEADVKTAPTTPSTSDYWSVALWLAGVLSVAGGALYLFLPRKVKPVQKIKATNNNINTGYSNYDRPSSATNPFLYTPSTLTNQFANHQPLPNNYSSTRSSSASYDDMKTSEIAAAAIVASALTDSDDDYKRSSDSDSYSGSDSSSSSSDLGFSSDNSDSGSFSGGGSDSDC